MNIIASIFGLLAILSVARAGGGKFFGLFKVLRRRWSLLSRLGIDRSGVVDKIMIDVEDSVPSVLIHTYPYTTLSIVPPPPPPLPTPSPTPGKAGKRSKTNSKWDFDITTKSSMVIMISSLTGGLCDDGWGYVVLLWCILDSWSCYGQRVFIFISSWME